MNCLLKLISCLAGWLMACLCLLPAGTRAGGALDSSNRVAFFISTADQLLRLQPGVGFSSTNFPIYPFRLYTPAAHRLFQLAANLTDARLNKTGAAPDDFDYPSVFRPTFGVTSVGTTKMVVINGWVEVGTNADYLSPPLSLPEDLAKVGPDTTNIYGIPWVIGARKGLPNFNEISVQSITQIARKLQIVKPSIGAARSTWHTNVQYTLGISNAVVVEAWNSYSNAYPRDVTMIVVDNSTMVLTNALGTILATNITAGIPPTMIPANSWPGFTNIFSSNSFVLPVYSNVSFVPGLVYRTNGTFTTNPAFDTTTGFPQPLFGLNVTNRMRFILLDTASGRVIDYVHLEGMNQRRRLIAELPGPDGGGPGGVWDTNRLN